MRLQHILQEAKGVFGRKEGDKFVNVGGQEAEFMRVDSYPSPDIAQFDTVEQRDTTINQYEQDMHTKIVWTNQPNSASLAFAVAVLNNMDGGVILWGRYLQKIKHNMMSVWANKEPKAPLKCRQGMIHKI